MKILSFFLMSILMSSLAFANNDGKIRVILESSYVGYVKMKCWNSHGDSTIRWSSVLSGKSKSCYGASYMRVDLYNIAGMRFGKHRISRAVAETNCAIDQTLIIKVKRSGEIEYYCNF